MTPLAPWANGTFELLLHAEGHLQTGEDFDRRMALISFDDAIEVAITTYLTLHPIQRGNRQYKREDVEKWLVNYHSKLDFLDAELKDRGLAWDVERGHFVWAHDNRNEQYHGGKKGTPEKSVLDLVRKAALWVFGVLFGVPDIELRLAQAILEGRPPSPPEHDPAFDKEIDREHGLIDIGDQTYYASDLLFSVDYQAYREAGTRLIEAASSATSEEKGENP